MLAKKGASAKLAYTSYDSQKDTDGFLFYADLLYSEYVCRFIGQKGISTDDKMLKIR